MISSLISLLVLVVVIVVLFWLVDSIPLPAPINMIVKAIIAIIALIEVLHYLRLF